MSCSDTICNSLLCFINSAFADYSCETLSDIIHSFYSIEEIKVAKEELASLLKKVPVQRRDPDKKKKELGDLIDFYLEFKTSPSKVKFVTDSHKKMPPMGFEMFASVLNNLVNEVNKINELLPKILDVKSEVVNTADTVRQMKIDIHNLTKRGSETTKGVAAAVAEPVVAKDNIVETLHSFRTTVKAKENVSSKPQPTKNSSPNTLTYAAVTSAKPKDSDKQPGKTSVDAAKSRPEPFKGATSKQNIAAQQKKRSAPSQSDSSDSDSDLPDGDIQQIPENDDNTPKNGWTLVQDKRKERRVVSRTKSTGLTGCRKPSDLNAGLFKAAVRFVDVFIGRVDNDVTPELITSYIKENFCVDIQSAVKLEIKSECFSAFKITVKLSEREKLFSPDLWPEDIIIDKFYNRSKGKNSTPPGRR